MKILIVNTKDIKGGAARAAYRLHNALLKIGMDSNMLVQLKASKDPKVIGPLNKFQKGMSIIRPELDKLPLRLYPSRNKTPFSPAWLPFSGMLKIINESDADLVHLHWIAGGMIRIEEIAKIRKPIVWTLHDMWVFTGGCHLDNNCGQYIKGCQYCPILGSKKKNDLSKKIFIRKLRTYNKIGNIVFVGLSQWMCKCAKSSKLLNKHKIVNLPNPIDTSIFKPLDKKIARDMLNIPMDKKLILIGAGNPTGDKNKGFAEFSQALNKVGYPKAELLVFGTSRPVNEPEFSFKSHYIGKIYDNITLRVVYSSADVMVVPSLQEAFGQTATEAMSCGTPVVAFGATGLLDIVDHKLNGYLAKPYDPNDLAFGIEWVLRNSDKKNLSAHARSKVLDNFAMELVAKKYKLLYEDLLKITNTPTS